MLLVISGAICTTTQAATHEAYENGNLSTTYITYFKDILSGVNESKNYVAFRSGQNAYSMIVGEIEFSNGSFLSEETCKEYVFSTSGNYNSQYTYEVNEINNFSLDVTNEIIYSDLGEYPQLLERGSKYEFLSTVTLFVMFLYFVVLRIFNSRKR